MLPEAMTCSMAESSGDYTVQDPWLNPLGIIQSAKSRAESHGHYTKQSVVSFGNCTKLQSKYS